MLAQCELCGGLRGHQRLLDDTFELFDAEYKRSVEEVQRLTALFKDVCWYNFETQCRDWKAPWYISMASSRIELYGHTCIRHGHSELTSFPLWYSGTVSNAPRLPVDIIGLELRDAIQYMKKMEVDRFACYDYAPGGRKYEELLREGDGVCAYRQLKSSKLV